LFKITAEEISLEEMIQRAKREDSGAIVTFLGTVRDDGIQMMEVEAFAEAAEAELELIRLEAIERFGLASVQISHRTGRLAVGESIVAIVCSAPHRAEAFEGCRYVIDELKKRATIWKKEIGENDERWVGEKERESKRNDGNQEMNGENKRDE
jgi:molybdopterin synthase catalytic subunit